MNICIANLQSPSGIPSLTWVRFPIVDIHTRLKEYPTWDNYPLSTLTRRAYRKRRHDERSSMMKA
jgi:hypothetical protein